MIDRGIIFSGPMVRALWDGHKGQTRRLASSPMRRCAVGDRLYVRENWQGLSPGDYVPTKDWLYADFRYAATDPLATADRDVRGYPWRPSIHMPRCASRLTLLVDDVRVEPLQAIVHDDAIAEGLSPITKDGRKIKWGIPDRDGFPGTDDDGWPWDQWKADPVEAYAALWDRLHRGEGERWEDNPQVLVLTFRAVRGNIDQLLEERAAA